jgi:hypothetical protein
MSLSQDLIVELAAEFRHLLQSVENAIGADDNCHGRIDIDVDSETLFLINKFEARVRHRQMPLRLADRQC